MCRIHSQDCIAGVALDNLNSSLFGSTSSCEVGASATTTSLKTLCYNMRELCDYVNFWDCDDITFAWPEDFSPIDFHPLVDSITDVQKLFCLLVSNKQFSKSDVAKKFVTVGVRWLGFFCSLLHICLSIDVLIEKLDQDIIFPSKSKVGIKNNTVKMLKVLRQSPMAIKKIYEFGKVHFQCWHKAVNSTGETLFSTALDTSKLYAKVGVDLSFNNSYFECINRHLYNAYGVFLPLSSESDLMGQVAMILNAGLKEGWEYEPAPSKSHLKFKFSSTELCNLTNESFLSLPGFRRRVFCSPLFEHFSEDLQEIYNWYNENMSHKWMGKSRLISGHNQQCERLIGDMKNFRDINTLVSVSSARTQRKRLKGNVSKCYI